MTHANLSLAACLVVTVILVAPVCAQWLPNGVMLSGGTFGGLNPLVPDGAGGAFVAWRYSGNQDDVFMQHITGAGTIALGWPLGGLPIASTPEVEELMDIAADGQGGGLVTWYDFGAGTPSGVDVLVQRVLADGSFASGWPVAGVRIVAPRRQENGRIISDGAGGAIIVFEDNRNLPLDGTNDVYAQHLLSDGTVAAGWPADGLPVCVVPGNVGGADVVPDGVGGAIFAWGDGRAHFADAYALRVHADGTLAEGWEPNGNLIALMEPIRGLCEDQAGGFYLWTTVLAPTLDTEYHVRRIAGDGTPAPGWTTDGVVTCNAVGERTGTTLAPDGQGGLLASWYDYRSGGSEIYALRILPTGAIAPGWTTNGTLVSNPANPTAKYAPSITGDGQGGAYLVWNENFPSAVQHLTATGKVSPGWPAGGLRLASSGSQFDANIASDGHGGAIVAWDEGCCGRIGVWAQRFVMDGIVAVDLALSSASAEPDLVRLEWFGAEAAGLSVSLERRAEVSPWQEIGNATADGTGHIRYEDRGIFAGERYGYRLRYRDGAIERTTSETWVDVPAALLLSLAGFRPNPAEGEPMVAFTLPSGSPGRLEVFDLAGRRVAERHLALPAGRHAVRLESNLAPGAYVMRLTHDERTVRARGVVVR